MTTGTLDRSMKERIITTEATVSVSARRSAPTAKTTRKTGALVGLCFLIATFTFAIGNALIHSYFSSATSHKSILIGSVCLFGCGGAVAANGAAMRRVLAPHAPLRSQVYRFLRLAECLTLVAVGVYFLTGHARWDGYVLAVYAVSGTAGLVLSSALRTSRIVPKNLSMLGLIGYPVFLAESVLAMFNVVNVTHGTGMLALVPGGLFELLLPVWLFTKGFSSGRPEGSTMTITHLGGRSTDRARVLPIAERELQGSSVRRASITAGAGLLLMSVLSGFGYFVAVKGLTMSGNATRTAEKIADHKDLFRFGFLSLFFVAALDVVVAWGLYRLFAPVSEAISKLAAGLRIAYAGIFVIAISRLVGVLGALGTNQQSSVLGRINSFTNIWDAGLVLFGLHLLVIRLPRVPLRLRPEGPRNAARGCRSRLPVRQPERGANSRDFDSRLLIHLRRRVPACTVARDLRMPRHVARLGKLRQPDRWRTMNAATYPVNFDLERPETMSRAHVFLRIALLILLSWIAGSGGGVGLVYLGVPAAAAILIARKGGARYVDEDGPRVTGWLAFIIVVLAYLALLTDELPGNGRQSVQFEIVRSGSPTVGSALWRIVNAIPSALVLFLISLISSIVSLIAAVSILVTEHYPEGLWNFQRAVVRWEARLLGYLASLVETYPPYTLAA
ncbi:MAG TPA: DUF4386 family protein [Acidimicrobiales bacterium]